MQKLSSKGSQQGILHWTRSGVRGSRGGAWDSGGGIGSNRGGVVGKTVGAVGNKGGAVGKRGGKGIKRGCKGGKTSTGVAEVEGGGVAEIENEDETIPEKYLVHLRKEMQDLKVSQKRRIPLRLTHKMGLKKLSLRHNQKVKNKKKKASMTPRNYQYTLGL
ncbi:unnamed protein product [Lactuca saligna]|uniref:Uncharacterized protein n=1 Tax=Lactuca saligna TaxID=75948 RepID=A0AA35ZBM7_LACSI|nr:unnamed protein product [Lactuca saligna]